MYPFCKIKNQHAASLAPTSEIGSFTLARETTNREKGKKYYFTI
jgi:hypothetical protein